MNKTKEYYQKLHEKLAKEHGVSSSYIHTIRALTGEGQTKKNIIDWAIPLSNGTKRIRRRGKKRTREYYIGLVDWLNKIDEKETKEILT